MVSITSGPIRTALLLVTLVAVLAIVCVLTPSEGAEGALTDPEPPAQYDDWDHAYEMDYYELGTPLHIRREGRGDRDYVRIPFLSLGDRVTIEVDIDNPSNSSEWWVSDPGRFPIWTTSYDHRQPVRKFEFLVTLEGPYWFHTGQGFGSTLLTVNISVVSTSDQGDGNERPEDAQLIEGTFVVNGSIGPPDDCSDFYRFHLAPSNETKVFLRFVVLAPAGSKGCWELYDSTGVQRLNLSYTQDCLTWVIRKVFDERIEKADTYYLRLWCYEGAGDYKLSVTIVTYPNDRNDELSDATWISDGDEFNGTIHTMHDRWDHYVFNISPGDIIQLWMDVDEDLDIFLLDEEGHLRASSDNWNDESEYISYKVPPGGNGTYYLRVRLSTELDPFPLREISYKLRVITNLPPEVDEDVAKTYGSWPMLEDRVDEGILLTDLFFDPEGDRLTFRVVPGHNGSRLNVTLTGADRLRLDPAENASGFVESVTVEAMDGRGKTVRFTIDVAVNAVNDAPMVGHPTASPPPEVLEMDEDTTGGPWDLLFWFWDCDNAMSEMTFSFETDIYFNAEMDEMDRLVIDPIVPDWNGRTNITIRVKDPGGLGALIRMPVIVRPVNDPPRRMGPDITMVVTGGVVASIDVTSSFMDVDGDILTLLATSDLPLTFMYDGYNITIDGLLPYQHTSVNLSVTAMDPEGTTSDPLGITLEVRDMDDPHTIEAWEDEYTVLWGRGRYFTGFTVSDPDGGHYEYVVVLSVGDWSEQYKYGRTTNGWEWVSSRPYWAPEWGSEEGDVVVTLAMYDSWYNASVSWVVHVRAENHPPEILEMLADKKGPYWLGQKVEFTTEVLDEEGDDLSYGWYLEGELVSEEPRVTLTFDTMGEQELVLEVSDGFNTTQRKLPFAVVEEAESLDPPIWTLAILMVAAVVVILALVFFLARR